MTKYLLFIQEGSNYSNNHRPCRYVSFFIKILFHSERCFLFSILTISNQIKIKPITVFVVVYAVDSPASLETALQLRKEMLLLAPQVPTPWGYTSTHHVSLWPLRFILCGAKADIVS